MKSYIRGFFVFLLLSASLAPLFGQGFGMGAILDSEAFERVEAKPLLLLRSYSQIPLAYMGYYLGNIIDWKKSLSEGRPVIIGMNTPASFHF